MRKTSFVLGTLVVIGLSLGLKLHFSSAAADTVPTGADPAPIVLAVQAAVANASTTDLASASSSLETSAAPSSPAPAPQPIEHVAAAPAATPKREDTPPPEEPHKTMGTAAQYPERLVIPSLNMNVNIQPVGLNEKGEMDVPNGSSSNVGWYKDGTMPGNVGSAVLDAHVFAVFKTLRDLKLGSSVYVETKGGTKLRFKVVDSRIYTLDELTSNILFGQHDARRLNLITCAGTFIPSIGTYDHRLVVFAVFQDEE